MPETASKVLRPRQVTLAAWLLVAAFLPRTADYLLGCFVPDAEVDWTNTPGWIAIGLGIRALFVGVLLLEVFRGRQGRFWVFVWLGICIFDLVDRADVALLNPLWAVLPILSIVLQGVAVWLLHRPTCDAWAQERSWRRLAWYDRGMPGIVVGAAKAAIPALVLASVLAVCLPHMSQTPGPISRERARNCPISLPATADDVQYSRYSHVQAYMEFVRFKASAADCIAHAKGLVKTEPKSFHLQKGNSDSEAQLERRNWFSCSLRVPRWFDVQNVTNGLKTRGDGPSQPTIWIDMDRGVFYSMVTD
jgi:hypothetical protein